MTLPQSSKPNFLQKLLVRNYKWYLIRITWFLATLLSLYLYKLTNKPTQNIHILKSGFDDFIPFTSVFVIPYLLYLPFLGFCLIRCWILVE